MLSRCKKGMMILTRRGFLEGTTIKTLIGQFAEEHVPKTQWVTLEELFQRQW